MEPPVPKTISVGSSKRKSSSTSRRKFIVKGTKKKWDPTQQKFIKKRLRKTPEQKAILLKEFEKHYEWTEEDKMRIAIMIDSDPITVGKWNWDERKKRGMPTERKGRP